MIEFIISLNNQDDFFFNSNEEVAVESTVKVGPFTCTDYRQTQGKDHNQWGDGMATMA